MMNKEKEDIKETLKKSWTRPEFYGLKDYELSFNNLPKWIKYHTYDRNGDEMWWAYKPRLNLDDRKWYNSISWFIKGFSGEADKDIDYRIIEERDQEIIIRKGSNIKEPEIIEPIKQNPTERPKKTEQKLIDPMLKEEIEFAIEYSKKNNKDKLHKELENIINTIHGL